MTLLDPSAHFEVLQRLQILILSRIREPTAHLQLAGSTRSHTILGRSPRSSTKSLSFTRQGAWLSAT